MGWDEIKGFVDDRKMNATQWNIFELQMHCKQTNRNENVIENGER